jgi:hypothetical protein
VSPLSLLTFFAAAKKVSAAPHRGNARAAKAQRGCPRKQKQKQTQNHKSLSSKHGIANAAAKRKPSCRRTGKKPITFTSAHAAKTPQQ